MFPSSGHLFQIQIVPNDHFAVVVSCRLYILPMVKTSQFQNGYLVVIVYDRGDRGENGDRDIVDLDDDLRDEFFFFADDHIQDHDRDHSA